MQSQTFKKIRNKRWNDRKAIEEFLNDYPECKNDPTDIVCDDCHKLFKKWFATLTDDQKKKMREDFYKEFNQT